MTYSDRDWNTIYEDRSVFPAIEHPSMVTLNTGTPQRNIVMGRKKSNGNIAWIKVNSDPVFDAVSGKIESVISTFDDITEIRKIRTDLHMNEGHYSDMVEAVEDYAIIRIDCNGIIQNWNKGAERIKGYKQKEIVGKDFRKFYREQDVLAGVPDRLLREATVNGKVTDEGWRVRKDGTLFWAVIVISAIKNKNGEITGYTKVTRDITERKNAEEKIQYQEKMFRSLVEGLPDATVIVDDKGIIRIVGDQCESFFGYPKDEMVGKPVEMLIPDDIASKHKHERKRYMNDPQRRFMNMGGELAALKKNGEIIPVEISLAPLQTSEGVMVITSLRNITDRLRNEKIIREAKDLLGLFVKHAPAAVAMFDEKMHYIMASDQWYQDYELSGMEIIGKSHYDVFPEIKEMTSWVSCHQRCLQGASEKNEKDLLQRKDGGWNWLQWEIHPWKKDDGSIGGIVMFTQIITERIEAEEKLKQLNERLVNSNKELEQFAYVASHDLQEPLRMVSSFLRLLEKKYRNSLDETAIQYIDFAVDGAERMKGLISDLLKFSRLNSKTLTKELVDCRVLVDSVSHLYAQQIKEYGVRIHAGPLPAIYANKTQIQQLFQNLIGNAIKYRGSAEPDIDIGCDEANGYWEFYVKDNGIGIDERYFEKIFVIFEQLHGKNEYEGTGIGLAVCRKIVELHGGKIWVESEKGKGSTFYFTILK